jgi:F-type H+-transporting ATPase subunit delta
MKIEVAAKRYAQAVFDIAREKGEFDRWVEDLQAIVDLVALPGVLDVLASSRVPSEVKVRVLRSGLADVSPLASNLAHLLVDKGRIGLTEQVRDEYLRLLDEHRGVAKAVVITAVPLSDDEGRAVVQRLKELTGKEIVLETRVEPGILGGLVARVGDRLIDGSTRTRLLELRSRLAGDTAG